MKSEGRQFLDLLEKLADPNDLPMLLAACAGRSLYISNIRPRSDNWMVLAIGEAKAVELLGKLNDAGWYPGEIEIPFNGASIVTSIQRALRARVVAGLISGKSSRAIAAECGITDRAVRLAKAELRRKGELPEASPEARMIAEYLGPSASSAVRKDLSREELLGLHDRTANLGATAQSAAQLGIGSVQPSDHKALTARERIIAIIERECGGDGAARIVAAAGGRAVCFRPRAVRHPLHPFRTVLSEMDSSLLAIKIVSSGLGSERVRLSEARPSIQAAVRKRIRDKLLQRLLPSRVASDLGVPIQTVRYQLKILRKEGLLPAKPRHTRTLRGY